MLLGADVSGTGNEGPLCVAVINLKGGVGKTTIAALLGRYAARVLGLKVLAVDLDPQANLSQAYMRTGYREFIRLSRPSIVEVFSGMHPPVPGKPSPTKLKIEDAVVHIRRHPDGAGHLDLIPSRFDFSNGWELFSNEIPRSRGFPKRMRGDYRYSGNATLFRHFAKEFFQRLRLPAARS